MNMYNKKLSIYYDTLYKDKDYISECNFIKNHVRKNDSLLDVGCGTLNHSILLSESFDTITAIDDSEEMIEVAKNKNTFSNIDVKNVKLSEMDENNKFGSVISMFNVVNHIESIFDLVSFFEKISSLIVKDGTFIFDCWNGVACTIEKPNRFMKKEIHEGYHTILSETQTTTDLFNSMSIMYTKIEVFDDVSKVDEFEYILRQKLWTPDLLKQLLTKSGFSIEKIIPKFDFSFDAKENDYKLTFICHKL